ncbi:helix-turn-helix domain-containing protein [Actinomadura atramentaria]|uniref:helix-turn-helix domain-containing protein n=1 Tax=Actinomadura atramentaria TaxID=1990 RepID=UPI000382CF82|nr:helix-turn-helix domain-containing protein [Actinomadura atramentaria]
MDQTEYRETAAPPVAGLACAWTAGLPAAAAGPAVQRVVPDACVDVVWWPGGGGLLVAGPDTGPAPAVLRPGDRLAGVRLRPGAAGPVLGVPPAALRDARVPLTEVWGGAADRLAERLAAADDPAAALAAGIAARAAAAPPPDPLAAPLARALAAGSVRDAAAALGLGERQVRRRAVAAFGYGPKTVQRVLRFQRALRLARAGRPLAEVAWAAGYSDQPHMAHDVRQLGGVPIRSLL